MKTLYIIGGTIGVGKKLNCLLNNSVFLEGVALAAAWQVEHCQNRNNAQEH